MLRHQHPAAMPGQAGGKRGNHGQRPHRGQQRVGAAAAQVAGEGEGSARARGVARSTTEKLSRASSSNSPRACISTNSTSCPAAGEFMGENDADPLDPTAAQVGEDLMR